MEDTKIPLSHKPRRGSETRQKQERITFRVTAEEHARLEQAAGGVGLTLGSYIREATLKTPKTRARRRPLVEVETLARLLGEMNRVGGNINQIARRINSGETPLANEIGEAFTGYRETVAAIMMTLGRVRP